MKLLILPAFLAVTAWAQTNNIPDVCDGRPTGGISGDTASKLMKASNDATIESCWMRVGVARGDADSIAVLGAATADGAWGTQKDERESLRLLDYAARHGSRIAMVHITNGYSKGMHGFPKDVGLYNDWLDAYDGKGKMPATPAGELPDLAHLDMDRVAQCYTNDAKRASADQARLNGDRLASAGLYGLMKWCWYEAAADKGDLISQEEAGYSLLLRTSSFFTDGPSQNEQGWKYLKAAVQKGSWSAMWMMAQFYRDGNSPYIKRDPQKAAYWFTEARKRMTPAQLQAVNQREEEDRQASVAEAAARRRATAEGRAADSWLEEMRRRDRMDEVYGSKTKVGVDQDHN